MFMKFAGFTQARSTENDRYVVYNYVENTWYIGELDRTLARIAARFVNP